MSWWQYCTGIMAYLPLCRFAPRRFTPWLFRPLACSPAGWFTHAPWMIRPWLVRPLAHSPPYVVSFNDRNSMPTTFFSFFSKVFYFDYVYSLQRKTTVPVQQRYKSKFFFRQIQKPKSIFYYLHSMCNRKYTFPPRSYKRLFVFNTYKQQTFLSLRYSLLVNIASQ